MALALAAVEVRNLWGWGARTAFPNPLDFRESGNPEVESGNDGGTIRNDGVESENDGVKSGNDGGRERE